MNSSLYKYNEYIHLQLIILILELLISFCYVQTKFLAKGFKKVFVIEIFPAHSIKPLNIYIFLIFQWPLNAPYSCQNSLLCRSDYFDIFYEHLSVS